MKEKRFEGKWKDALFIWQSVSIYTNNILQICLGLHCLWFFQTYHVSQGLRIWVFVLKTPKDIREWPSARKEGNEGHKVMKDVTFFWLLDSFGGFESKTGPGFFFFSHPCLQVQYQGIDTIYPNVKRTQQSCTCELKSYITFHALHALESSTQVQNGGRYFFISHSLSTIAKGFHMGRLLLHPNSQIRTLTCQLSQHQKEKLQYY